MVAIIFGHKVGIVAVGSPTLEYYKDRGRVTRLVSRKLSQDAARNCGIAAG